MDKVTFYAPIEKADEEQRMVYGYASTEALDSQGEVVKKEALSSAIDDYMKWANIREMHQPSAVGKTKQANLDEKGMYIAAKIVDEEAWKKVKEGVYNGFSIGGRIKTMKGNEIVDLSLSEISLVDRPANPECKIDVFKADMEQPDKNEEKKPEEVQTPEVDKKEEVGNIKKNLYTADSMIDLALSLSYLVMCYKDQNKDSTELVTAMNAIKEAAKKELSEKETYYDYVGEQIAYAENIIDLEKDAIAEMKKKESNKEEEMKAEKALKIINDRIMKAQMPTDEEIAEHLKCAKLNTDPQTIAQVRWEISGKVMEQVAKHINAAHEAGMAQEIEKKGKTISAATKEKISTALKRLQDAIKVLANLKDADQLTPDERSALDSGVSAGSTITGSQDVIPASEKAEKNNEKKPLEVADDAQKAEIKRDNELAKVVSEVSELKGQIQKLLDTPMPITARASYVTVEKFEPSIVEGKKSELAKAQTRSNELTEKFQKGIFTEDERIEAQSLGLKIMKLKREVESGIGMSDS